MQPAQTVPFSTAGHGCTIDIIAARYGSDRHTVGSTAHTTSSMIPGPGTVKRGRTREALLKAARLVNESGEALRADLQLRTPVFQRNQRHLIG